MVEIGLGEAIAGGTNLSGEFGSPITRSLALREQNELRRLQIEEARAAKERAAAERVGVTPRLVRLISVVAPPPIGFVRGSLSAKQRRGFANV